MDTKSVWNLLSGIPIGTIVAWIIVIGVIIGTLCTGTIKLYKVFTKYKSLKDRNEEQTKQIEGHDEVLKQVKDSLKDIKKSLDEQKEVNLKQVRYNIVHACDDAISAGAISAGKLRSIEEMYEEYTSIFHGNGYVKTMVLKARQLPISRQLDE